MSRYKVSITRNTSETTFVVVFADNAIQAKARGLELAQNKDNYAEKKPLKYLRDDGACSHLYITGCGMVSQTAEELCELHGVWGEHDLFPASDWSMDVQDEGTRIGYWDWVVDQIEAQEFEQEDTKERVDEYTSSEQYKRAEEFVLNTLTDVATSEETTKLIVEFVDGGGDLQCVCAVVRQRRADPKISRVCDFLKQYLLDQK
jgi:hypothetical protein